MEVAFAGEDYGEGPAVGREGVFADGEPAEKDVWLGLGYGNFGVRGIGAELRNAERGQVSGFLFDGALEIKAGFVGGPLKDADAYAEAGDAERVGEIADFQDFLVEKICHQIAAGRDRDAAGVGLEGGDFLIILRKKIEALEARGTFEMRGAFDGDACVAAGDPRGAFKGAPFEGFSRRAGADVEGLQREEALGHVFAREIDEI